jgi:aryl-alcohol dehydrogenase-like predicted oxidoreductase
MQKRSIGPFQVGEIALGCMNLNHAYGPPVSDAEAERVLLGALDLGVDHFDTAALYGGGLNEELVGRILSPHRQRFMLASKCGMTAKDGKRVIDGRPETLRQTCEQALRSLCTDVIDLYYLHRWDRSVPVEESVGAMADLIREGKIRGIGLSEVSAATLRRAHAEHPIIAVQTEYSLWTRNAEVAVLDACRELGTAFVAFSPLGRGFLAGGVPDPTVLRPQDIRRTMPRFMEPNFSANQALLADFAALARDAGASMAQLALAWLLHRAPHIIALPGTTSLDHLADDVGASGLNLSADVLARAGALFAPANIHGPRYNDAAQADVDTEELPA